MANELIDSYGRVIDYLRISVTDRCNLRCVYCMPPQGVKWKPHDDILTFEEMLRITNIMASLGVRNIKVTGGEPFLRRGTSVFLKQLKTIKGIERITLTTNGLFLGAYLNEVKNTGLDSLPDGINISLDALDSERYKQITGTSAIPEGAEPEKILGLVDFLLEKQITVKINCVPVRNINEQEIIPLASLAKDKNIIVRFIELMPIGCAASFKTVSGKEAAAQIEKTFGILSPVSGISGNGPASYYSLEGFKGKIGFINAVTHNFCAACNRLRLTSVGFLKLCLSNDSGLDLRQLLRSGVYGANGACDDELIKAITEAVAKKPRSHLFSEHNEGMYRIGG